MTPVDVDFHCIYLSIIQVHVRTLTEAGEAICDKGKAKKWPE